MKKKSAPQKVGKKGNPKAKAKSGLLFERLEDRVLYSASPHVGDIGPDQHHDNADQADSPEADGHQPNSHEVAEATDSNPDSAAAQPEETHDVQPAVNPAPHGLNELLIVDGAVENLDEVAASLEKSAQEGVNVTVLKLDRGSDGLAKITEFLEQQSANGVKFDALHVVSHSLAGELRLGNETFSADDFDPGTIGAQHLAEWRDALTSNADILLYGCDVAAGDKGLELAQNFALATGADVAGSDDPTGSVQGSDWILEVKTDVIETAVLTSTLDVAFDTPNPVVTISAPASVQIGQSVDVSLSFDNTALTGEGFGPYVDVFIDRTGADGVAPGTPSPANTYDGFTSLTQAPTYLGASLNYTLLVLDDTANGGLGVMHPYQVTNTGAPVYVRTTDAFLAGKYQQGDWMMVIELPYGSFVSTQPAADIDFQMGLSNLADINTPIRLDARGGFRYGADPLSNPGTDPAIVGGLTSISTSVNPSLMDLRTVYVGPENETATGPNYVRQYQLILDVANGQTLTNVHIVDMLAAAGIDAHQFVSLDSVTGPGYSSHSVASSPSTTTPGGTLDVLLPTVVGTSSTSDVIVTFSFYVPRFDSAVGQGNAVVINASTGAPNLIENQAFTYGSWDPLDSRDAIVTVSDETATVGGNTPDLDAEHVLEAHSVVIQKNFTNITNPARGGDEVLPGDIIEFTLNFQISDYFAFEGISIIDLMSDGLRLDGPDVDSLPDFTPTLSLNGNTYVLTAAGFVPTNWTQSINSDGIYNNGIGDGSTTISFDVSGELISRAAALSAVTNGEIADKSFALLGQLLGGGVNPMTPNGTMANNLTGYNAGATTGQIVYRAVVLDSYTDTAPNAMPAPSAEPALNPRDQLTNRADVYGTVLNLAAAAANPNNTDGNPNNNTLPSTGNIATDDTAELLSIKVDVVQKEIYAVNGILNGTPAFNAAFRTGGLATGSINLQPDDEVTYRLLYTVPSGDVEHLRFTDFLPLPIFDVEDPDANGVNNSWTFLNNLVAGDPTAVIPASGVVTYGPTHTLNDVATKIYDSGVNDVVELVTDATGNSLRFNIGTTIDTTNTQRIVDILFTVTVNTQAFADGLFLTNQVQSGERNTRLPDTPSEANTNAIVQIVLNQPKVTINKGVVASTKGTGVVAGGLTFNDVGADGFTGTLTGAANAAAIGALNLTAGTLPDAGDQVRFAIVAQNVGRSDAFDLVVTDTVQGSFANNYANAAAFVAATNLKVYNGAGTQLTLGSDYTVSWNNTTKEFQVSLTDPSGTDGRLNRGINATVAGSPSTADGSNAIVILYDLTVDTDAQTGSTVRNTAQIINYTGADGETGPQTNHATQPLSETSDVTIVRPDFTKALVGTEIDTTGNGNNQAVIGELVTYTLTITVPEGTTASSQIIDRLDPGLAFVGITGVSTSSGVTVSALPALGTGPSAGTGPANVTLGNVNGGTANQLTFNLGTITNTNVNDAAVETITITYQAVVLNTNTIPVADGNQSGTALDNTATFSHGWTNDGVTTPATGTASIVRDAADVTLVEPHLNVDKQVGTVFSAASSGYGNTISNQDAGNTVYFSIVITNDGPTWAHDITLSDVIPANVGSLVIRPETTSTGIVNVNGAAATVTNANFQLVGQTLSNLANLDLAPGAAITIHVQGTLVTALAPSTSFNNDAVVRWSSLDGTVSDRSIHNSASDERDGSGVTPTNNTDSSGTQTTLNNYGHSDRASVEIAGYGTDKTIVATDVASSAGTDVVVGETVRYRLVVWLPEGTSNNLQIQDNLPNGLVFLNNGNARYAFVSTTAGNITSSAVTGYSTVSGLDPATNTILASPTTLPDYVTFIGGVTSAMLTGTFADSNISDTVSGTGVGETYTDGEDVFFRLGNVVNSESDGSREMVIIEFDAYVANVVGNQAGTTLTNTISVLADSTADGIPGYKSLDTNRDGDRSDTGETSTDGDDNHSTTTGPQVAAVSAGVSVTVREPVLTIGKTITTTPVDAGDTITYQIVITNSPGGQTAYEVTLNDAIDSNVVVTAGTISASTTGTAVINSGGFEIAETSPGVFVLRTQAGSDIDIPAGSSITLSFSGQIAANVTPGTTVNNVASTQWSSLPGGLDGDDAGALTERTGSGGINDYTVSSGIASQVLNSIDIVKDVFTTSLGGNDGVVTPGEIVTYIISVTLPEGVAPNLRIRDALPVGMAYVPGSIAIQTGSFVGSAAAPTASQIGGGTAFGDGTDVEFSFTSITTNPDNNTGNNTFTFTYQAVVLDVGDRSPDGEANDGQGTTTTTLTNTATHNNGSGTTFGDPDSASVSVVEPDLNVQNAISISGPQDAGAAFTYTITVRPTLNARSGAYEISVSDTLPAELGSLAIVSAIISDGATNTNVAANFSFVGNTLTTGTPIDLHLDTNGTFDQELTIVISGTLTSSVNPGETVNTSTSINYTNYPGNRTQAGSFDPNPTVTTDRERAYIDTDAESFTAPLATFAKSLFSTNQTFTSGSSVAVGESVTYALRVTLPEGTTPDLSVLDRLPPGLQYLSSQVVTTAAASNGLLAGDFNGTVGAPIVSGGLTDGADVSYNFGSISITGDNDTGNNSFLVLITARVTNVVGNQAGTILANDAQFDISGDGQSAFTTPAVNVSVVEPRILVDETILTSVNGLDAGDSVTYQITLTNTTGASADAFDVAVNNVLPAGLVITSIGSPSLTGGSTTDAALSGVGGSTLTGMFDIPLGGTVTFTFTAQLQDSVTPNQTLNSDVNVTFSSLNGDETGIERTGADILSPEDNTPPTINSPVNNYAVGDDIDIVTAQPFSVTKALIDSSLGNDSSLNVVIGETLTYRLTVAVMEGTTNSLQLVDSLPRVAGVNQLVYVPGSAVITNANGMVIDNFAVVYNPLTNQLTITAASVTNPGNVDNAGAADTDAFTITYQTQVADVAQNQSGTNLTNDVDATATNVPPDNNNQITVNVREPVLTLDKTTTTPGADGGDTVVYTLVITNTGDATAYDIEIEDMLDAALELVTPGSALSISVNPGYATLVQTGNTSAAVSSLLNRLDQGDSITITITAQVKADAVAGDTISNSATVTYTSLPGTQVGERTGDGGVDDYTITDPSTDFTLSRPTIDKLTPSDTTYAIGELVTFDILVTIPEGTTSDLVVTDQLPAGLVYTGVQIVTSAAGSGGLLSSDFAGTVGAPTVGNPSVNLRTFEFGNLIATANGVAGDNTFLLRVTARVDNVAGNQGLGSPGAATELSNTASLAYTDGTNGTQTVVDPTAPGPITVVEPVMTFDKVVLSATTGLDAGDTVQYQVTFANNGTATAHDVNFADTLPPGMIITSGSVSNSGGVTVDGSSGGVGQNFLNFQFTIPVGGSVTVTYSATLPNTVTPDTDYTNSATLNWSSINGNDANERTGGDGTQNGGTLNDYSLTDSVTITTVNPFSVEKSLLSTSNSSTAGSDVVVGEVLTYQIAVSVMEGTTNALALLDNLPRSLGQNQLVYVPGSAVVSNANGVTVNGFNATYNSGTNQLTVTATSVTNPGGSNTTTNNAAAAETDTFYITYQVIVANVGATGTGTVLVNDVDGSATDVTPDNNNTATVTVVAPDLVIDKTITTPTTGVDAGDTVEYQIEVRHSGTSGAHAYDLNITDDISAHITNSVTLVSAFIGATDVSSLFAINGSGDLITIGDVDLLTTEVLTLRVSGVVRNTVQAGTTIANAATVTWTSLDDDATDGSDTDERLYSATDLAPSITTVGALNVSKVADKATATIGEVVTYTVSVTVGEGRTDNLLLNDTLPAGFQFIAGSAVVSSNPAGMTIIGFDANTLDQLLTVTNPGNNTNAGALETDTFLITYQARVLNVASNQSGTMLTNDLDASATNLPSDNDNQATVTVVEPDLVIDKSISTPTAGIDAGDTVRYQINVSHSGSSSSNAYDLILNDALPAGLENYTIISAIVSDGFNSTNVAGLFSISPTGVLSLNGNLDLLRNTGGAGFHQGLTLILEANVTNGTNVGSTLSNTATVLWSSLDGGLDGDDAGGDERTGAGDPVNDYTESDTVDFTTQAVLDVSKTADVATAQIGDVVEYTISVRVAEGRTVVNLADTLPPGMQLVANSFSLGSIPSGLTVTGLADNSLNQTLTVVNGGGSNSTANNAATTESDVFTLTYRAIVQDVASNDGIAAAGDGDGQTALVNDLDSSADLNNDGDTNDAGEQDNNNTATTTVIEPQLQILKSSDDADGVVSRGQVVTYTLTITHRPGSTATAYDVMLRDLVPSAFTNVNVTDIAQVGTVSIITDSSSGNSLVFTIDSMEVGSQVIVTFTATVDLAAGPNLVIDNNARIYWDSQAADDPNAVFTGTPDSTPDRDYGAGPGTEVHSANTDPAQDTERVTVGTASFGDRVWLDMDGDDVQDALEPGIGGVTVFVDMDADGIFDSTEASAVTDATGFYQINGLAAGTYTVRVLTTSLPSNVTQTYDLNGSQSDHSAAVTLTQGQTRNDVDFGYQGAASIGDRLWADYDGNGSQNGLEPGVAGATVNLYRDLNNDGDAADFGEGLIATTVTNGAGDYTFAGLIGGNYFVEVDTTTAGLTGATVTFDKDDYGTVATNNRGYVSLGATENDDGVDFGFRGTGSIGDLVWNDLNGNGARDAGEPGIAGVTIDLILDLDGDGIVDAGDNVVQTLTTDINGAYDFTSLLGASYIVNVTDTGNVLASTTLTGASGVTDPEPVLLAAGQDYNNADFGYVGQASIANQVWFDLDNDGVQDAGELGIPGVRVYIDKNGNNTFDAFEATAITDASGQYLIDGLIGGNYTVRVDATTLPPGSVPTFDLDGIGTANAATFVLGATQDRTDIDFGYRGNSSLGDTVWMDLDSNGSQNGTEPGIPNVAVQLYWDANNNGTLDAAESATPLATLTTDLEGNYSFTNLVGGRYFVQVDTATIVTGATPTCDLDGIGTANIATVNLAAATNRTDVDFGYNGAGSIGDLVWNDLDGDGVRDAGEPGLGNVTIDLYIDKNGNGIIDGTDAVMATTTTATDGTYGFTGLVGGNYLVQVTDLNNVLDSADPTFDLDGIGTANLAAVSLTPTQDRTDVDFGYQGQAAIGNFVWNDLDNDGAQDPLEPGIGGVRVWLDLDNDGSVDTFEPFAITDATGAYNITGLVAGTYRVRVDVSTLPASVTQTYDQDGIGTANQAVTTLGATEIDDTLDFGYVGSAALGNRVWNDYNADGVQDAREPGVVGVTINLYRDLNSDGLYNGPGEGLIAQTTTGADGAYSFTGLIGGGYIVEVTDTAALLNGATATHDKDDFGTVADNGIAHVSLDATEIDSDVDFGYVGNISIGDRVWFDVDGDGVQDNSAGVLVEPGIPGATVYIDLDGDNTFDANEPFRVTDNDGLYSFGGLIEGTYTIRVINSTLPDGATQTYDLDGIGTPDSATQAVVSGDVITTVDFGYRGTASIGDRVWLDIDGDGVQDGSEPGIAGVTVDLFRDLNSDGDYSDAGEGFIQRVTTGANGIYNFTDLLAGGYVVQVTDAANVLAGSDQTYDLDGIGTANLTAVTVTAGQTRTDVDFGYQGQASVAGTVFDDRDNDGIQDVGENGIQGAQVTLTGVDALGNNVSLTLSTDLNGNYIFDNLWTSDLTGYTLTEITPAGYLDGIDVAGTIQGGSVGTAGNDVITGIILPPGLAGITYTFGELVPSSLAGKVYIDQSGDGAFDVGEPGLPNVTVTLTGTDDRGNAVNLVTVTNGTGDYLFADLRPGTYTITETQPVGLADGGDSVGTIGGTVGNDVISNIAVSPAQDGTGYNFGEGTTSISGTVYQDLDTDATRDPGEAGMSGITIELYDSGNTLIATTTTDINGNYTFAGLVAGNYTVVETQPAGYGSSDTNSRPVTLPVTGLTGINFGETRGFIEGAVYFDADGNGIRDVGEVGIGGVTVTLSGTDANGAVSLTVTTGADGTYRFDNLLGGTYELTETQPGTYLDGEETVGSDGGVINAPDSIVSIVLTPGAGAVTAPAFDATGYLFGEQLTLAPGTGAIAGTVYHDEDLDTTLDSGETGISGVTVRLRDNLGNLIATTTTDASGSYAFVDLPPGNYTVEEVQPLAYGSSTPNSLTPVLVVSGTVTSNQNFGETDGSIAGSVYVDTDNDGIRDGGENGIAGVTVTLSGTDFYGNAVNRIVTTDLNGNYLFDDLLGGNYTITETQPAGINDGTDSVGSSGGVLGNDVLSNIGLGGGVNATNYNFGERPSTISGTVFLDNDRDGAVDPGDNGIAGVVVSLVDAGGTTVATTTTDVNGNYQFTGMAPGNYTIVETQPTGYGSSPAGPFASNTRPITLGTSDITNQNFGETVSSVAGRVYIDANTNGADDGEAGIAGVLVTLTGTDAQGNAVSITTTSGSDGSYIFTNLLAGTYNLSEAQPAAYLDGGETVGTAGGATNPPNDVFVGVGLGLGIDATGYNFGERINTPAGTGAIVGNVYLDRNLNADLTSGEPGIGGVTVELYNSGNVLVATTTTAPDGSYSFTNLTPDIYEVRETQPIGYGTTTPNTISTIVVTPNSVTSGVNFGESLGSLSGNVFYDQDEDGVRDSGEPAISGVTVTLTGIDANGNPVNRSTTTAADGSYRFDDLLSGTYTLTEIQPAGWADGAETLGSEGGVAGNDFISAITLPAAANGIGYDFGELGADISGTVFLDADRDGTLDGGESGLSGITIRLIDSNGAVGATSTTPPDGTYEFENVAPGDYTVQELQPGEYGSSSPNTIAVTVAGTDINGLNYGETTGSIAGSVYIDADSDGIRDAGEVGIGGVQVDLTGTDINGNPVSFSTTTAADGTYLFTGLLTGTYVLTEPTQPAPYLDGGETAGTGGGNTTANETITDIGLGGGEQLTDYLFGERGEVDLVVSKGSSGTFAPGQTITYTITVRNVGNQDATQVVVTDTFPSEALVFLTASNGGTIANGVITWDLGTISAFEAEIVTLTVTAQVRSSIAGGLETITNTVTAMDDGTNLPDPTPDNNTATDTDRIIARPELEIDINDFVTRIEKGDKVVYVVTVKNKGNQDATNVEVDTIFPDDILRYIRDSLGNGTYTSRNGDDLITWQLGTVRAGETVQFTITALADREIDRDVTDITAIANVRDDGAGTNGKPLTDTDDDIDQPIFPSNIDLAVTITDHRRNVDRGDGLTFEVLAQNLSGTHSRNVVVTVELDKDVVFISAKHGGVYDAKTHTITWTLNHLRAGQEKELLFQAEVNENAGEGNLRLDASIRDDGSNGPELTMANNTDPDIDIIKFSEADETLIDYFADSFNNYLPADEEELLGLNPIPEGVLPILPLMPIYSGHAEPGATVEIELYNIKGALIGTDVVMADAGGNWLAKFPNNIIYDTPTNVVQKETKPTYAYTGEDGFNLRTYFSPAINPSHFFTRALTVGSVFSDAAGSRVGKMQESSEEVIGVGDWEGFEYEFLAAPGTPSN